MAKLNVLRLGSLVGSALILTGAYAGDISANYTYGTGVTNANVNSIWTGATAFGTTQFQGVRTGGSDTFVPNNFNAYCVEIGETLGQGGNYHPNVVNLLGASTNAGGTTGPILFDAVRTANLQTLWGSYFSTIGVDPNQSAAFQLAQWEIAFDDDLTLVQGIGSRFWVDGGQFQGGITDAAETMLTGIRTGSATSQQQLVLLTGAGVQDLVTPVPEPASLLILAFGGVAAMARRRRNKNA